MRSQPPASTRTAAGCAPSSSSNDRLSSLSPPTHASPHVAPSQPDTPCCFQSLPLPSPPRPDATLVELVDVRGERSIGRATRVDLFHTSATWRRSSRSGRARSASGVVDIIRKGRDIPGRGPECAAAVESRMQRGDLIRRLRRVGGAKTIIVVVKDDVGGVSGCPLQLLAVAIGARIEKRILSVADWATDEPDDELEAGRLTSIHGVLAPLLLKARRARGRTPALGTGSVERSQSMVPRAAVLLPSSSATPCHSLRCRGSRCINVTSSHPSLLRPPARRGRRRRSSKPTPAVHVREGRRERSLAHVRSPSLGAVSASDVEHLAEQLLADALPCAGRVGCRRSPRLWFGRRPALCTARAKANPTSDVVVHGDDRGACAGPLGEKRTPFDRRTESTTPNVAVDVRPPGCRSCELPRRRPGW